MRQDFRRYIIAKLTWIIPFTWNLLTVLHLYDIFILKSYEKGELMKISARNVLKGKIKTVKHGSVNSEITIELPRGIQIVSIITKKSAQNMRLSKGKEVYAVIKASNVMVAIDWRQVFASSNRDCRFEKAAVVRQNQAELIQNHYRTAFQIFRLPNQRGADVTYFTF